MHQLIELLKNDDEESYRKAADIAARMGQEALVLMREAYRQSSDAAFRMRIVRISSNLKDSGVIAFLENALDDSDFEVRRSAALALKILIDEDYYGRIYKSEIGKSLKRDFWCHMEFVDDDSKATFQMKDQEISKDFAAFFKLLSSRWSYSEPANPKFFSFRRKKSLSLAEDGRILFRNFNYSLGKILQSGRIIIFLINNILKVVDSRSRETTELEDILRCMKQSLGIQFREIEEGLGGFIAAFHFVRLEFNISLDQQQSQYLELSDDELSPDQQLIMEKLTRGIIDFSELHTELNLDPEKIAYHLVQLRKLITQFVDLCVEFGKSIEMNPKSYLIFKKLGMLAHHISIQNLCLLSYWTKDE